MAGRWSPAAWCRVTAEQRMLARTQVEPRHRSIWCEDTLTHRLTAFVSGDPVGSRIAAWSAGSGAGRGARVDLSGKRVRISRRKPSSVSTDAAILAMPRRIPTLLAAGRLARSVEGDRVLGADCRTQRRILFAQPRDARGRRPTAHNPRQHAMMSDFSLGVSG